MSPNYVWNPIYPWSHRAEEEEVLPGADWESRDELR